MQRTHGCLYCGRDGPRNREHVIPAGLGAGDAWVLDDLVCQTCNEFFSQDLEVSVLRRGEIGLGRLALQRQGRSRGNKTRAPTFEMMSGKLLTEDGRALEISLGHGLAPQILTQITLHGEQLEGNGSDRRKVEVFLRRLERVLSDRVELITKRAAAGQLHTCLELVDLREAYVQSTVRAVKRPGGDAIWLEMPHPEMPGAPARILERERGSLVVQVQGQDVGAAAQLLSIVKRNVPKLLAALTATLQERDVEKPQIRIASESPLEVDVDRLVAKIGFNLLAFHHGAEFCRHGRFDACCAAIRSGTPSLRSGRWDDSEGLLPRLKQVFARRHWMMLAPIPNPETGGLALAFGCSLYGGASRLVILTEDLPSDCRNLFAFHAVDYQAHTVQRYDLLEVTRLTRHVPNPQDRPGD